MYQHNPELRGSEILGNEVWENGNFKLPIINYDSLSLRALAAIICHEDEKKRSWFCNGQNYRNSPCIVFDYFHKEFIGKSLNHRIGHF